MCQACARAERNARVYRRLLALHHLALGYSVEQAALVSISQIYNWIERYETQGLEGMRDRLRCRAPQRLARQGQGEFVQRVLQSSGADSGLAAWRVEHLRAVLHQEFDAHYSLLSVYALLHWLGL